MFKSVLILLLLVPSIVVVAQSNKVIIPDKAGDFKNGIYHVGLWVEDADEMITFLTEVSSLKVISHIQRPAGGERYFLSDARGQRLELLSDPENIKPHTQYPLHPKGAYAGMAHISIEVDDVVEVKKQVVAKGYEVIMQVPRDFADGYITSEIDAHRVLFIKGPSSVSFEFFEIKK